MDSHPFMFLPGRWIGEGKIQFSISPEILPFYTRWSVDDMVAGVIRCHQHVEMAVTGEVVLNSFTLSKIQSDAFHIEIENNLVGIVKGKGHFTKETVGWEFKEQGVLQGYESFHRTPEGHYVFHAEYSNHAEDFRTIIDGQIYPIKI